MKVDKLLLLTLFIMTIGWTLYTITTFGPNRAANNSVEAMGMITITLLLMGSIYGILYCITHWKE